MPFFNCLLSVGRLQRFGIVKRWNFWTVIPLLNNGLGRNVLEIEVFSDGSLTPPYFATVFIHLQMRLDDLFFLHISINQHHKSKSVRWLTLFLFYGNVIAPFSKKRE
jgi:hypothetical protein